MPSSFDSGDIAANSTVNNFSFYDILEVSPQSSQAEIRDAYRRKSKQFHPDTTLLDKQEAARRFQLLKRAYETLRFPDQRQQYDRLLAKQRVVHQMRSPNEMQAPVVRSSASLDPEDRALSAGEIFALFILGITFLFCLLVAIFLGISRGEMIVQSIPEDSSFLHQLESVKPKSRDSQKKLDSTSLIEKNRDTVQSNQSPVKFKVSSQGSGRQLFPPTSPH